MYNSFATAPEVIEIGDLAYVMWSKGWDESNGGNISYILSDEQISRMVLVDNHEVIHLENVPMNMVGKYLLITASGSQFRILKNELTASVGVIRFSEEGYSIVAGFENGAKPTSELYMHVLSHSSRLNVDPHHRIVVHNHANNATALTLLVEPDDKSYTLPLWKILTESIIVFPDGVGVLPWELPGTESIGINTSKKLEKCRVVVWAYHGVLATGSSFQDCFGLIETVDKAAEIFIKTLNIRKYDGLTTEGLIELCKKNGLIPRMEIFD